MIFQRVKDKLGRFNRKKFQQLTIDDSKSNEEDKKIINKNHKKFNDVKAKLMEVFNKTDWRNLHQEFFNPSKRNIIHKTFQFAMIFGFVFIAGKNTALLLKGADKDAGIKNIDLSIDESKLLTSDDINNIKLSKVFKTDVQKPVDSKKPKKQTIAKCKSATRKSTLPIKLINTIVLQDSVKSIAAVQVRSANKSSNVREGDKIQGMAELGKIDRMKIIIKNLSSGTCEFVEAAKKGKRRSSPIAVMTPKQSRSFKKNKKIDGIENDGNEFTIEKAFLQDKLKDINSILTQARGIQLTNPDGTLSFKIVEIQPGSVFSYLGVENNDIITEIGGQKINDLNQVMSLFGKIGNLDKLNLKVKRNGEEVPLNYKFR
jgi:type II secretory pathway component PulC